MSSSCVGSKTFPAFKKAVRLSAVDSEGSEVILTVNLGTGAISITEYVNAMDR